MNKPNKRKVIAIKNSLLYTLGILLISSSGFSMTIIVASNVLLFGYMVAKSIYEYNKE